jgi:uncharacterized protein
MVSSKALIINLIKHYISVLRENNISIQKVMLFGSYMNGQPKEDSDIDIAIISPAFKGNRYSDRRFIVPFRRGIDSRIEPLPFTPEDFAKGGILIDEIKRTGEEIL